MSFGTYLVLTVSPTFNSYTYTLAVFSSTDKTTPSVDQGDGCWSLPINFIPTFKPSRLPLFIMPILPSPCSSTAMMLQVTGLVNKKDCHSAESNGFPLTFFRSSPLRRKNEP